MNLIVAAIAHVGFAVLLHATPIPRWIPHRPISCGFCMTIWFSLMWWAYQAARGEPITDAILGMGISAVAGALAVGYMPWAFRPEKQPG